MRSAKGVNLVMERREIVSVEKTNNSLEKEMIVEKLLFAPRMNKWRHNRTRQFREKNPSNLIFQIIVTVTAAFAGYWKGRVTLTGCWIIYKLFAKARSHSTFSFDISYSTSIQYFTRLVSLIHELCTLTAILYTLVCTKFTLLQLDEICRKSNCNNQSEIKSLFFEFSSFLAVSSALLPVNPWEMI